MTTLYFRNGTVVLEDRLLPDGSVLVEGDKIRDIRPDAGRAPAGASIIDLRGGYLFPGFVDLHVHGGDGPHFLGGPPTALRPIRPAPARHGTTRRPPTAPVAPH